MKRIILFFKVLFLYLKTAFKIAYTTAKLSSGGNCLPAGCVTCEDYYNGQCTKFGFQVLVNVLNPPSDYLAHILQCTILFTPQT